MARGSLVATVVVGVPLAKDDAIRGVQKRFPHDESALRGSLFHRQTMKTGELPKSFVSAYSDGYHRFTLIIVFQDEKLLGRRRKRAFSVFEVRVEPGPGVDARWAAENAWNGFAKSACVSHGYAGPKFAEAVIRSGNDNVFAGYMPSFWGLMTGSSELRLPALVGAVSAAALAMALLLGVVPGGQVPAAWWGAGQMVAPALGAVALALLSDRRRIRWRVE